MRTSNALDHGSAIPVTSSVVRIDYRYLVSELKANDPDKYERFLSYLAERFMISESDLHGHEKDVHILSGLSESASEFDRALIFETTVARASIKNVVAARGDQHLDEEDMDDLLNTLRANYKGDFDTMETEIDKIFPNQIDSESKKRKIDNVRSGALIDMDRRHDSLIARWKRMPTPFPMSDEEMKNSFFTEAPASHAHLTTYFGSAFKGLVDRELVRQISEKATFAIKKHGKHGWKKLLADMQVKVARALDPLRSPGRDPRFMSNKISFHENCSEAFQKLMLASMRNGDRVLAASEEFNPMLNDMIKHGVKVEQLKTYRGQEAFLRAVERELSSSKFDYILVSEVSRMGTVYPLEAIHQIRQGLSTRPKLIVDAAQSAGRWQHNMFSCQADAVVLSTSKGSATGPGMGVLAVTDELSSPTFDNNGTRHHIPHAAYAMSPSGLLTRENQPQILTPYQRQSTVSHLSGKFIELRDSINAQHGSSAVELLNPFGPKQLGHAVEIKIKGVKREYFAHIAELHGVYVDSDYGVADDESIRIAFHPYMNNKSLLILGGVIEHCIRHPQNSPLIG